VKDSSIRETRRFHWISVEHITTDDVLDHIEQSQVSQTEVDQLRSHITPYELRNGHMMLLAVPPP